MDSNLFSWQIKFYVYMCVYIVYTCSNSVYNINQLYQTNTQSTLTCVFICGGTLSIHFLSHFQRYSITSIATISMEYNRVIELILPIIWEFTLSKISPVPRASGNHRWLYVSARYELGGRKPDIQKERLNNRQGFSQHAEKGSKKYPSGETAWAEGNSSRRSVYWKSCKESSWLKGSLHK